MARTWEEVLAEVLAKHAPVRRPDNLHVGSIKVRRYQPGPELPPKHDALPD